MQYFIRNMNVLFRSRIHLALIAISFFITSCDLNSEIGKVTFGVCSDVHLPTMHDSEKRISSFIDSMKSADPDFIIELGDFGTPNQKYAHLFDIWNLFPGEKYHVIGNHEMDGGTSLQEAIEYRGMERSYYSFEKNGFLFLILDCNDKKYENQKGYRSYIGEEQQKWLKEKLTHTKFPVIIFSHQGIGSDPGIPGERYSIENSDSIRKIFEDHNDESENNKIICCFNGHTHNDYAEEINGIWYITINSMAYKWLGEEYEQIRYNDEVDKNFKWIKYTAPYKDPLYSVVEISS